MVSHEPNNEEKLCEAVKGFLEEKYGEKAFRVEKTDRAIRDRPAVDMMISTSNHCFAIEHTRIEGFPDQIEEGLRFARFVEPLENALEGKLHGEFSAYINVGDIRGNQVQLNQVRNSLEAWIIEVSHSLKAEEDVGREGPCEIIEKPPGVPFKVELHRELTCGSDLRFIQNLDKNSKLLLYERVQIALSRKCPKLADEKKKGATSVLILEFNDLALLNRHNVADAVLKELKERNDVPDILIIARTSNIPWKGWLIKEGSRFSKISTNKGFCLDRFLQHGDEVGR